MFLKEFLPTSGLKRDSFQVDESRVSHQCYLTGVKVTLKKNFKVWRNKLIRTMYFF